MKEGGYLLITRIQIQNDLVSPITSYKGKGKKILKMTCLIGTIELDYLIDLKLHRTK